MKFMKRGFIACILASTLGIAPAAHAAFPEQPIRLIVPHPAGGSLDILARTMAAEMGKDLGVQIVVENKGGGNGAIAAQTVATSKPDGYTLLLATASTHGINPSLYKRLRYDAIKDFAPITLFATVPNVLVIGKHLSNIKTTEGLIELIQERKGKMNMGSAGSGTPGHLAGVMVQDVKKLDFVHVPYRGGAPAISDLIAGQIDFMFTTIPGALPHINANNIIGLSVTSKDRSVALPDLPTIDESALPGFEAVSWHGLVAPAGTPQEIIDVLYKAAEKALKNDIVKEKLAQEGARPAEMTQEQFGTFIQQQIELWRGAVQSSGASID